MRVALVTGAGGFVGGHLCTALTRRGWSVRSVPSGSEPLAEALDGVDAIYHLAAIAHEASAAASAASLHAVNVELPARWFAAADRAGVPAFVWLSSIKVLGDVARTPLDVDAPYAAVGAYAASKVAAEQRLAAMAARRTRLAVVRPPLVYGPGVKGNFRSLLRWAASGMPLPLANARELRTLVGVDNLCDLLALLGERPRAGVYHVGDADDVSVRDLVVALRGGLGMSPRLFALPPRALATLARAAGRGAAYSRLFDALRVDTQRTRDDLGWRPPHTRQDQLERTLRWFSASR